VVQPDTPPPPERQLAETGRESAAQVTRQSASTLPAILEPAPPANPDLTSVASTRHDQGFLTVDQLRAAIARGTAKPGQPHGLHLSDTAAMVLQALGEYSASQGQSSPGTQTPASGFQIVAYTPVTWVAQNAADALAARQTFTLQSVTDEMNRPVLRVVAAPSTPPRQGINFGLDVASVKSVYVRDATKKLRVDPTFVRPFAHERLQGLIAEFPIDQIVPLRGSNPEFQVVVEGTNGQQKAFTIKRKHFEALPF
jgi:hypothetical protein